MSQSQPSFSGPSSGAFSRALSAQVDELEKELVEFRRDVHAHPELAWAETRTTERVAERLSAEGIDVKLMPKSGLLAEFGDASGPVVALRADLDALPVRTRPRTRGGAPSRASPMRAGTTCTPLACSAPGLRCAACTTSSRSAARSACSSSPRRRSCRAAPWR